MHEAIIDELIQNLKIIEDFDKDSAQDGEALHAYLIQLGNLGARSNYLMADFKRRLREEKQKAYLKLTADYKDRPFFAVSMARDYVECQCANTAFVYELAERLSRSCVHVSSSIITIISSLKSEKQFSHYQT